MTRPRASIVIRCLNEARGLARLLDDVFAQTEQSLEVLLVDSGSTDESLAIAGRYPVRLLHIQRDEFTFGRALNRGCEAAHGEFLVLASGHVYPRSNRWLERLLRPFEDPRVACAYGRQQGNAESKFSERRLFAQLFPERSNFQQGTIFCNNANCAIRRALWERRRYDETLPGLEDLEWASWAIAQGHLLAYVADAEIVHVHRETLRQVYNRHWREALALKRILPQSRIGPTQAIALTITNVILDAVRAMREWQRVSVFGQIVLFRAAQYWGAYQGFRFRDDLTRAMMTRLYYPRQLRRFRRENIDEVVAGVVVDAGKRADP